MTPFPQWTIFPFILSIRGRSHETQTRAGGDAAPAGGARNPALGRPRDPTGRYYGRSAGEPAGLGPLQRFRTAKAPPAQKGGAQPAHENRERTQKSAPGGKKAPKRRPGGGLPPRKAAPPQGVGFLGPPAPSPPGFWPGPKKRPRQTGQGSPPNPGPKGQGGGRLAGRAGGLGGGWSGGRLVWGAGGRGRRGWGGGAAWGGGGLGGWGGFEKKNGRHATGAPHTAGKRGKKKAGNAT